MAPKKVTNVEKPKRTIIMTTVELKKELITKWEKGTRVADLAVQYGMAKSTISTLLKNREAIKAADVVKGLKSLTSKRPSAVEEVEKLLMVWISENSWLVIVCLRLLFVRKLGFCTVTLREVPLILVLKNLRLVKGGLTILKREQVFTV
jgi:hypothetical protein